MARTRTTKVVAQRIDLNYFKRPTPFKRAKLWLAILAPVIALVWMGWGGTAYDVPVPTTYPSTPATFCQPVLSAPFRFSWSLSRSLTLGSQPLIIAIGEDTTAGMQSSRVSTDGCPYAPGASSTTTDGAFVYTLATLDQTSGELSQFWPEVCLLQTNSIRAWQTSTTPLTGQSYPSLLDPTSPQLGAGDRNFQYSGSAPYLYYTQLNPRPKSGPANNRDLVRLPLSVSW